MGTFIHVVNIGYHIENTFNWFTIIIKKIEKENPSQNTGYCLQPDYKYVSNIFYLLKSRSFKKKSTKQKNKQSSFWLKICFLCWLVPKFNKPFLVKVGNTYFKWSDQLWSCGVKTFQIVRTITHIYCTLPQIIVFSFTCEKQQ